MVVVDCVVLVCVPVARVVVTSGLLVTPGMMRLAIGVPGGERVHHCYRPNTLYCMSVQHLLIHRYTLQ